MMEFDDIVVKESPGLCRCCLSEGCYKDLGSEYTWMNDTEIYADMLLECFDISISQHNDGPNGRNRLICEVCITRLRDACNFKKQVLDSEKKFVDMIGRGQFGHKVVIYQSTMKSEAGVEVPPAEEGEVEYLEEEMDFVDDEILNEDESGPEASVSDHITVAALAVKGKRGRPKKTATVVKTERKAKVAKLEEKPRTSKAVSKDNVVLSSTSPTDIGTQKRILTLILENSTAMPFRWCSNKYMCFYCCCKFVDSSKLKSHTSTEHEDAKLNNVLKSLCSEMRVKLDISNISCKRCLEPVGDLNEFARHVLKAHDLDVGEKFSQFIYVFKLSDNGMDCLDCTQSFRFFGPLLIHVYKDHRKVIPYLCEICGRGFVAQKNMRHHVKNSHFSTIWSCQICEKTFQSQYALKSHRTKTHKSEKLKCPKCQEVFGSTYFRKRHLALVHDVKSIQFTCEVCSKVFTKKSSLLTHEQRVHLKEKKIACGICGFKVFSKDYLMQHMVKHIDERPHECEYCKKTFRRKKNLQLHIRIHTDDRRYACKDCGKAFVQVSSLKLHMRTHHSQVPAADNSVH